MRLAQGKLGIGNRSIGFQSKKQDANSMMTHLFSRCLALKFNRNMRIQNIVGYIDQKSRREK